MIGHCTPGAFFCSVPLHATRRAVDRMPTIFTKARLAVAGRVLSFLAIGLVSLVAVLWGFCNVLAPVLVWLLPSWEPALYDVGVYGPYRVRSYASTELVSPEFSIPVWNDECDDGRHVLLTPKGDWVPNSGPMVVDPRGNLVWVAKDYRNAMNLNLQSYKGENFLTFWTGDKAATSGQGVYYMLDSTYTIRHTVKPHGASLHADLHEFQITSDNTGLLTIYNKTTVPMTFFSGKTSDGHLTESAFQEVDIATGDLVFEWRASDHYDLQDSYYWQPFGGWSLDMAYDWFHINSLEKDSQGNFLVSSRHLHMVTSVDGKTGQPLWTLGGKKNNFKDLSDGKATNFQWQHDARWVDEEKGIISLYDNGDAGPVQSQSPYSRAIVVQIDMEAMTVKLLHEYASLRHTKAASQGSVQVLQPEGNVFVGWGHSASYSEYREGGELMCEWHFSPSVFDYMDFVASYRAQKRQGWVGQPNTKPSAVIRGGKLFVSWNGATEVDSWSLQATRMYETRLEATGNQAQEEGEYEEIDVMLPQGFETTFILPDNFATNYASLRVAALGKEGELLDFSPTARVLEDDAGLWESIFFMVLCIGFLVGGWIFFVKVIRKQDLTWPGLPPTWQSWSNEKLSGMEKWNPWSMYRGYRKLG